MSVWRATWLIFLVFSGCDDSTGGGTPPPQDAAPADMAPLADMAPGPDAAFIDMALPDREPPGFVELTLTPRKPLYSLQDQPQVTAVVYDRVGQVIEAPIFWQVVEPMPMPTPIAMLDGEQRLTFLREGPGAVRACTDNQRVCGRVSFYVDDGAPLLELASPARGAFVDAPEIAVAGRTEVGARVFVNEVEVDVGADGAFATTLPATFGLNRVDVFADDGVHRPPPRIVREVVYAPVLIPVTPTGVRLADMVALRIGQPLLDGDVSLPAPDEAGVLHIEDIAGLVEGFLARVEPMGIIGDPVLANDGALRLEVVGASLGVPDATLRYTDTGLEIFLRLEDLEIRTEGRVDLEGVPVDLTGSVRVTGAAFALVAIESGPDGSPGLRIIDVGVAIEALGGDMADSTAQAVLDTVGSIVRSVLQGFASDLIDDLVREAVPGFIELGLDDALETLADIPVDLEASDVLPAIALNLGLTLREPQVQARDGLALLLDGEIRQRNPVVAPHEFPGVPAFINDAPPWPADGGLVVGIRLATVNALAHELWRQGLLRIDLAGVVPENLRALVAGGRLDGHLPPVVVGTPPGSPHLLEIQIGDLDLFLERPNAPAPDQYVMSLRAGVGVQPGEGGIRLTFEDAFDLRVELVEGNSAQPIGADGLEAILKPLLLDTLRDALNQSFDLPLGPLVIGRDAYAEYAPGIRELRFAPTFDAPPFVRAGWLMLPVGFAFDLAEAR
jgi:hypothetical protein